MSVTDDLLRANRAYAEGFDKQGLQKSPRRRLAVVACMDSRIDLFAALGLAVGDAHVIRNAGGVVTDDVVRSLVISQRLLGTEEVVLVHHTDCGMVTFTDDELADRIHRETGMRPPFAFEAFTDLDGDVRESIRRLRSSPFLADVAHIRGFVYDVESGRLREVTATA